LLRRGFTEARVIPSPRRQDRGLTNRTQRMHPLTDNYSELSFLESYVQGLVSEESAGKVKARVTPHLSEKLQYKLKIIFHLNHLLPARRMPGTNMCLQAPMSLICDFREEQPFSHSLLASGHPKCMCMCISMCTCKRKHVYAYGGVCVCICM
jgi:hypothetical protein